MKTPVMITYPTECTTQIHFFKFLPDGEGGLRHFLLFADIDLEVIFTGGINKLHKKLKAYCEQEQIFICGKHKKELTTAEAVEMFERLSAAQHAHRESLERDAL